MKKVNNLRETHSVPQSRETWGKRWRSLDVEDRVNNVFRGALRTWMRLWPGALIVGAVLPSAPVFLALTTALQVSAVVGGSFGALSSRKIPAPRSVFETIKIVSTGVKNKVSKILPAKKSRKNG